MAASMSLRDEAAVTSSSLSSSSDPLDSSFLSSDFSFSAPEPSADSEYGFSRPDFAAENLAGTVDFYDRHVFLCYKNPRVWPPRIAAAEFDRVPRLLSAALSARKPHLKRQTRLTICEGHDGTETSNGDVLIFPDMVRYRRLTHFDVETFVEEVLVNDSDWLQMTPESLKGSYIFVCCHGSRDRRCGVCGPALVSRFRDEIELHGLLGKVSVSPCSHIGGHKYAGNVIIFSPNNHNGEITGHWYGYVTLEDVTPLLELHIGKGEIVDRLWRGQMGLSKEEQIGSQNSRLQMNGKGKEANEVRNGSFNEQQSNGSRSEPVEIITAGCCKGIGNGNGNTSCCQNVEDESEEERKKEKEKKKKKPSMRKNLSRGNSVKGNSSSRRVVSMPTWLESWERDDTYAALAVAFAALSVAVAYSFYRHHSR